MVLTKSQSPKRTTSSTAFRLVEAPTTTDKQRQARHLYKDFGGFVIYSFIKQFVDL